VAKAKKIAPPGCQEPAAKVIQQVLLARLKKMCALRERALHWNDPEGVHAMRVASRRLRSAVSDFKPYLRKDSIPSHRLKTIAKSLGAVRDEDVVLAALEKLRSRADTKVAEGIKAIAEDHRRRQRQARSVLESAIRPAALAELRDDFRSQVRMAMKIPAEKPDGEADADRDLTFSQVGVRVIGVRLQQLSEAGNSVYHPLQTKNLHELRIHAKRLRYAVELFAACWGDESRKFAAEIAHFQTSLGELHDCDVWIDNLGVRLKQDGKRKSGAGRDPGRNNETVVWLLQHFASERTKHYCHALARWHKWETEGFLDRLRTVLNAGFTPSAALPTKQKTRSAVKSKILRE
jgi:CHAD domain-containing protein